MPELEVLERMIEQASRGDWIQDALLWSTAADFLDKGEPLPPPLRSYIVRSIRAERSTEAVAAAARELGPLVMNTVTSCFRYLSGASHISREEVADSAVNAVRRIRQVPRKLGRGLWAPETLRDLEAAMVWVLFMLEYWEIGIDRNERQCNWQEATAAVSERLGKGYRERSIGSILRRFNRTTP